MNHKLCIFLAFAVFFCAFPQDAQASEEVIFVDTRVLLLIHPLAGNFIPQTRRFSDTPTDPAYLYGNGENTTSRLKELEEQFHSLIKDWEPIFESADPKEKEKLEKEYLRQKKKLELEISLLRRRLFLTKSFPQKMAFTELKTIQTPVIQIFQDIQAAVKKTREETNAALVLDVSSLQPSETPYFDQRTLISQGKLFLKPKMSEKEISRNLEWLAAAKGYWAATDRSLVPIVTGAADARKKSIDIMKSLTEVKTSP